MASESAISRRTFLTGKMPAPHHVSSAVVVAPPAHADALAARLAAMPGVEVHAHQASRIVITIEGTSTGALGETLTRISQLDGVIAANMVFEHVDEEEVTRS